METILNEGTLDDYREPAAALGGNRAVEMFFAATGQVFGHLKDRPVRQPRFALHFLARHAERSEASPASCRRFLVAFGSSE